MQQRVYLYLSIVQTTPSHSYNMPARKPSRNSSIKFGFKATRVRMIIHASVPISRSGKRGVQGTNTHTSCGQNPGLVTSQRSRWTQGGGGGVGGKGERGGGGEEKRRRTLRKKQNLPPGLRKNEQHTVDGISCKRPGECLQASSQHRRAGECWRG